MRLRLGEVGQPSGYLLGIDLKRRDSLPGEGIFQILSGELVTQV